MKTDQKGNAEWPQVICFVGSSRSGKTTLIVETIPRLQARGYRVGTIKHHAHSDFEFDVPGKDSWHYAQAGSEHVIIASPEKIGSVERVKGDPLLIELVRRMPEMNVILVEGYHWESWPKVEVLRSAHSRDLRCDPGELSAVVSDMGLDIPIPVFDFEQMDGFVDWIERTFLIGRDPVGEDTI